MEFSKLYEQKYDALQKAVNRQEGAYVPTAVTNNGGGFSWCGKTIFEVAGKHQEYAEAITSFMSDMWVDTNILSMLTATPRQSEAFPTAEYHFTKDGTLTHMAATYMKPDEYDQLIENPGAFIGNVLLPRKYPYLYEDRETAKAALKVYAEESVSNFVMQVATTNKYMAEAYGVSTCTNIMCNLNTPLDHIFDFFRGFRGTLTDLRRQPAKVQAALDAIWEYHKPANLSAPYDPSQGYPFQPCHIPAYLSPKQFKELYWPYEKQLVEWVAQSGGKILLVMEGNWENIWENLLELPKDSLILNVDEDDFLKVHERLGDHHILCGGLRLADTRLKSFDQIKDDIKRVIDTCAPGGGFIFSTDRGFVTPGDVNPTLVECFNFAHEYSKK